MAGHYSVIFVTVPDKKTADKITDTLLQEKFAACVNRVPNVASRYWWEGKIEEAEELLLIIKTRTSLIPVVTQCVKENHSYTVPEVISLPIADGNKAYLDWLGANTLFTKPPAPKSRATTRASEDE